MALSIRLQNIDTIPQNLMGLYKSNGKAACANNMLALMHAFLVKNIVFLYAFSHNCLFKIIDADLAGQFDMELITQQEKNTGSFPQDESEMV